MNPYADFSGIAFAYDYLAKITFGNAIERSQIWTLKNLRKNDVILIQGGGTGWILEKIDKLQLPMEIVYVEPSDGMMRMSKNRKSTNLNIYFLKELNGTEHSALFLSGSI